MWSFVNPIQKEMEIFPREEKKSPDGSQPSKSSEEDAKDSSGTHALHLETSSVQFLASQVKDHYCWRKP